MGYILVKAPVGPPREGDISPDVLFRRTKKYAKMTPEQKAKYEERVREKAEREARREKIRRELMGTPELAEEQPKVPIAEEDEEDGQTAFDTSQARMRQAGRRSSPSKLTNPDLYQQVMDEMIEAANVRTRDPPKDEEAIEDMPRGPLGDTRYRRTQANVRAQGEARGLTGSKLEDYIRQQMKEVHSGRVGVTGQSSRKIRGAYRDVYIGEDGDVLGYVDDFDTRPAGAKVERRWDADARLEEGEYASRVERKQNISITIDRMEREARMRKLASLKRLDDLKESDHMMTSFEPNRESASETPHVQHMEARGKGGADIPEPSEMHQGLFGSTKKMTKYHAPLKTVLLNLIASDPKQAAEILQMPHLEKYGEQLQNDEENWKLKRDKEGNVTGFSNNMTNRGMHLLNVLGDQAVRAVGGGMHTEVLNRLGLSLYPGHEKYMPGEYALGNPEEIQQQMAYFEGEGADPMGGLRAEEATHQRFAEAQGVPEEHMDDFTSLVSDFMQAGAPSVMNARDRALHQLVEEGAIPETALQTGDEGIQDYSPEFKPRGTLEATQESDLIEEGMPADEYASQMHRWKHPVTGEPQRDDEATVGRFPTPDPKFTMTEAEKIAQQKAKYGAMIGAARRRQAEAVVAEEAAAMAPDTYANITAGMDEEQKRMFYESMGIEAPPDERTAADLAPVAQEPLAQNAPYDPTRETPEEFDMRRRGKVPGASQGVARRGPPTGPEVGLPKGVDPQETVAEMRARGALPQEDEETPEVRPEDDEKLAMVGSGFSLGSQLLKAILDDMLK